MIATLRRKPTISRIMPRMIMEVSVRPMRAAATFTAAALVEADCPQRAAANAETSPAGFLAQG
jgi:hypothetical protein